MLLLGFIFKFFKKSLNRFCHIPPVPFVPPVSLVPPVPPVSPVPLVSLVPLVPLVSLVPLVPPVPALPILPAFSTLSPVPLVALFRAHYRLKKLFSLWYIKENSRVVLLYCVDFQCRSSLNFSNKSPRKLVNLCLRKKNTKIQEPWAKIQ